MSKLFKDLFFLDSTFRDGTQGFSETTNLEDALEAIRLIDSLCIPNMFVEAGFASSARTNDIERLKRAKSVCRNSRVTAFGRLDDGDIAQIINLFPDAATLVGKTRLADAVQKWGDPEAQLKIIRECVEKLIKTVVDQETGKKMEVIYDAEHFFSAYQSGKEGKEYAQKTLRAALDGGASWAVLCDTVGEMNPNDVKNVLQGLFAAGFKASELGVHFHNCRGYALSNTEMAFSLGIRHIQGVFGEKIGDNGGNLNLITFILNLYYQKNEKKQIITKKAMRTLTPAYHAVCTALGITPDPGAPYVGLIIARAGMHASGIIKSGFENYLHFNPRDVGNQLVIGLDDLSGGSNILEWARLLGVEIPNDQIDSVISFFRQEMGRGKAYRTYSVDATASFHVELLFKLNLLKLPFEIVFLRAMTEKQNGGVVLSEAHLNTKTEPGEESLFRQFGGGEVNAMEKVLRKAWYRHCKSRKMHGLLKKIRFDDYKLQVLSSSEGSGSAVRVFCTFTDGKSRWSTVGVDKNATLASWESLCNGYLYGMLLK